jgi:hypothetical protein
MTLLLRRLAAAALAASTVPGVPEWVETGDERELSRRWRDLLLGAVERMTKCVPPDVWTPIPVHASGALIYACEQHYSKVTGFPQSEIPF